MCGALVVPKIASDNTFKTIKLIGGVSPNPISEIPLVHTDGPWRINFPLKMKKKNHDSLRYKTDVVISTLETLNDGWEGTVNSVGMLYKEVYSKLK